MKFSLGAPNVHEVSFTFSSRFIGVLLAFALNAGVLEKIFSMTKVSLNAKVSFTLIHVLQVLVTLCYVLSGLSLGSRHVLHVLRHFSERHET